MRIKPRPADYLDLVRDLELLAISRVGFATRAVDPLLHFLQLISLLKWVSAPRGISTVESTKRTRR